MKRTKHIRSSEKLVNLMDGINDELRRNHRKVLTYPELTEKIADSVECEKVLKNLSKNGLTRKIKKKEAIYIFRFS